MAASASSKGDTPTPETIKDDIERLREEFATLRSHLGKVGEDKLLAAGAKGRQQVEEIEAMIGSLSQDLRARGELGMAQVERTIQERPMTSLLAAFGIGMLISMLISGRRR